MDSDSPSPGGQEPIPRPDVEARRREIARVSAEIKAVKRQIQAERDLQPIVDKSREEESDISIRWDEMTREQQLEWISNMRKFVEEHREELAEVPHLDGMLDRLERISEQQHALIRLEDEAQDLILQTYADEAEANTRLIVVMAEIMDRMENFTEEDWQNIPLESRTGMVDLLNAWHNGEREACFSQLPIEIRRRYE